MRACSAASSTFWSFQSTVPSASTATSTCAGFVSCGWLLAGRCTLRQIRKLRFLDPQIRSEFFGPGHLWFLEYLLVMLLAYGLVRWWSGGRASHPTVLVGGSILIEPTLDELDWVLNEVGLL